MTEFSYIGFFSLKKPILFGNPPKLLSKPFYLLYDKDIKNEMDGLDMANYSVIKVSTTDLVKMKQHYQDYLKFPAPAHTSFAAKYRGLTITAYNSGKVMFQGNGAETEAAKWGTTSSNPAQSNAKKSTTNSANLPKDFATWSVIGSDEVGNGSYFGPVTVCAAYVDKSQINALKSLGVRDSKELNDTQIRQLAAKIKPEIAFKLLTVVPQKYNQIQKKYNANHMKAVLHNQAIFLLLKELAPLKPEGILIDQFTPEPTYRKYLVGEPNQVTEKIHFITKGEQYHVAVAAASIICRAAFLDELDRETAEIGFTIPSGAGANVDLVAKSVLEKGGLELLANYAKLHFANTEKALKLLKK